MAVDPFLLGADLTSLTISGLTVASNGSLSIGSTIDVTDDFLEVDPTTEMDLEDIRATNQVQRNMVMVGRGTRCRVVCLQRSNIANAITTLVQAGYLYYQLNWTQGAEPFVFTGKLRSWNGGIKNRGANPLVLELEPVNQSGAANLIRS